jgi:DNA-binding NarL/FixJ family response regulator
MKADQVDKDILKYQDRISIIKLAEKHGITCEEVRARYNKLFGKGRCYNPFSPAEVKTVCVLYQSGMYVDEIAIQMHRSISSIRERLLKEGVKLRPDRRNMTDSQKAEVRQMYKSGVPVPMIAKQIGRSGNTVRRVVGI